jgi:hypothetical protein
MPNDTAHLRRLGDVNAAAALLDCSTRTVRRLIATKQLPGAIRLNRLVKVDLDVLGKWLDDGAPPVINGKGGEQ